MCPQGSNGTQIVSVSKGFSRNLGNQCVHRVLLMLKFSMCPKGSFGTKLSMCPRSYLLLRLSLCPRYSWCSGSQCVHSTALELNNQLETLAVHNWVLKKRRFGMSGSSEV